MKKIRILSLAIAMLMLVMAFTACNNNNNDNNIMVDNRPAQAGIMNKVVNERIRRFTWQKSFY